MNVNMAAVGYVRECWQKIPCCNSNPDAIEAGLELTIAYSVLENRYKIWNSIFWKRSSAALKRQTNERMYGLCFDAYLELVPNPRLIIRQIQPSELQQLQELRLFLESRDRELFYKLELCANQIDVYLGNFLLLTSQVEIAILQQTYSEV